MGLIAKSLELRLMKTDEESGERELDKVNMNDALKVMKQQSDEMRLLVETEQELGGAQREPPRAREGGGRQVWRVPGYE